MDKNKLKQKGVKFTINPEVRFGKPTVPGTRVAIEDILRLIEAGYSINDIPTEYPKIDVQQAKQALAYTAAVMGKEEIYSIDY